MNTLIENISSHKNPFIPFLPFSYPTKEKMIETLFKMQDLGVSAVEIGAIYSDPSADGPTIRQAYDEVIKREFSLEEYFRTIKDARKNGLTLPIILFSYLNPLMQYGFENLIESMDDAGIQGLLVVDLLFEDSTQLRRELNRKNLSLIALLSPTTSIERLREIGKVLENGNSKTGDPFYYTSRTGVTGAHSGPSLELSKKVGEIKKYIQNPLMIGFGISTPEQASEVLKFGDAAVVGSALVKKMKNSDTDITEFLTGFTVSN